MKYKIILLLGLLAVPFSSWANQCVEETTKIELPEEYHNALYLRLSPNGKHIIATLNDGGVGLLKISYNKNNGYSLTHINTPLKDEAFPVEPEWNLISSPYHEDGTMKYFVLRDIETLEEEAEPVFSSYFNEFYHSIGGDADGFSVTRWSFLGTRDYVLSDSLITSESDTYTICPNLYDIPDHLEKYKNIFNTIFLYVQAHIAGNQDQYDFWNQAATEIEEQLGKERSEFTDEDYAQVSDLTEKYLLAAQKEVALELVQEGRASQDDYVLFLEFLDLWGDEDEDAFGDVAEFILEQPILSQNRDMIAGLYENTMKVYEINEDKSCTEVSDIGFRTSKVTFSYNDSDFSDRLVTFYSNSWDREVEGTLVGGDTTQVSVFNITKNESYDVALSGSESFPNLTKDGRLLYFESGELVIIDLNSYSEGRIGGKTCVTAEDLDALYADPTKR